MAAAEIGNRQSPIGNPGEVDLHAHTVFSDGLFTPEELVAEAARLKLTAVAITDHDAVGGIDRAVAAGRQLQVEVVPGVEMSCNTNGVDVHVLAYYVDCTRLGIHPRLWQQVANQRRLPGQMSLEACGRRNNQSI